MNNYFNQPSICNNWIVSLLMLIVQSQIINQIGIITSEVLIILQQPSSSTLMRQIFKKNAEANVTNTRKSLFSTKQMIVQQHLGYQHNTFLNASMGSQPGTEQGKKLAKQFNRKLRLSLKERQMNKSTSRQQIEDKDEQQVEGSKSKKYIRRRVILMQNRSKIRHDSLSQKRIKVNKINPTRGQINSINNKSTFQIPLINQKYLQNNQQIQFYQKLTTSQTKKNLIHRILKRNNQQKTILQQTVKPYIKYQLNKKIYNQICKNNFNQINVEQQQQQQNIIQMDSTSKGNKKQSRLSKFFQGEKYFRKKQLSQEKQKSKRQTFSIGSDKFIFKPIEEQFQNQDLGPWGLDNYIRRII